MPALEKQRQADLGEFEVSLVYVVNSRIAKATQKDSGSRKPKGKN